MTALQVWITILGLTAVTVVTRAFFLMFGARLTLSERLQRALRYAPAAALIAVIVPDLLLVPDGSGTTGLAIGNHKLIAALVAGVFFWFTRKMIWMIVLGMVVYTGLRLAA